MRGSFMKKNVFVMLLLSLAWMSTAYAASNATPMPGILANARFVYVTAYDGDQFDPRLLPEDRAAIGRAEDAIQKWGKLSLVYRQQDADVVLGRSSLVHQRTCWLSMTRIAGHRRTISGA